nr:hypothetical protein [uncultured Actinoplanes sp.]
MRIDAAVRAYDEIERRTGQVRRLLEVAGGAGLPVRRPPADARTRPERRWSTPERPPFWAVPASGLRRPARTRRWYRCVRSPARSAARRGPRRHG